MELTTNQSRGLQTAWLLSTLGYKASSRGKLIRKEELLKILIPELCNELIERYRDGAGVNIRFSSNVLHGISILYGSKIAQVLNEVTHVQLRLQNAYIQLATRQNGQLVKREGARCLKQSEVLRNDVAFHVEWDLMPQLQIQGLEMNDLHNAKRRKLEIAEFDLREFSITDGTTGADSTSATGLGQFTLAIDGQTDANFDNMNLSIQSDEPGNDDVNEHVNLQFNEDGEILEILKKEPKNARTSLVVIEIEHSRRREDSLQLVDNNGMVNGLESEEGINADLHDFPFDTEEENERQKFDLEPRTAPIFRVLKRKLVIDGHITLTREFIINHHDNYATMMSYRASCMPQQRRVQQVYQQLNMIHFRPWANGNSVRDFNSSSIEESINRTMGIFHRTGIMANEVTEQARNSQVLTEVETSRVLQSDDLSQDLEEIGHRDIEDAEMNFDAAMLDLDFNLDGSRVEEDEEDEEFFLQSSSLSLASGEHNLHPNLMPRLKKLVKYFIQRLTELNKPTVSQQKEYHLTFEELVPVRDNYEVNSKKIAAGAFSSILFLINKSIVSIDVDPHAWPETSLLKSSDINLTLHPPATD